MNIINTAKQYDAVIADLKPDYVIHGDNWKRKTGPTKAIRDNVEKLLAAYGGRVIDVPYTFNENVKNIDNKIKEKLRPIVKAIESHSGLTGLIAEKTVVEHDGQLDQFDAM